MCMYMYLAFTAVNFTVLFIQEPGTYFFDIMFVCLYFEFCLSVSYLVVGYWHGYLSGARCRLAYRPADATATHCLLLQ